MSNTSRKRRALVTGATGFIGSYLARRLMADQWDVSLLIRTESKRDLVEEIKRHVDLCPHDGSMESMTTIIKKAQPDVVFHLASLFIVEHQADDIERLIQSNVLVGTQLVEAMMSQGISHLVNTGTAWQHYDNQAYNPVNLYAATKQAFEAILKYYTEATSLKVITLKLFDTYGPEDPRPKLFALLQKAATQKEPIAMSAGEQKIDLVYIDDVVEAYIVAANRLLNGQVQHAEEYAITSGKPLKLKDLVALYNRITGDNLSIQWGGRPYRKREVMTTWMNGRTLSEWKPSMSLQDGIRRVKQAEKT